MFFFRVKRPIEKAPKDGRELLIFGKNLKEEEWVCIGRWADNVYLDKSGEWQGADNGLRMCIPTHFCYLLKETKQPKEN